ncbi:MAG: exonuclease SbcCD subunit D [Lachnospiraceae bacterium]|jgi:exonuclease SbcD|nr:exonuclease SbcCD subunit D [Lachnospiraceae bacterium]
MKFVHTGDLHIGKIVNGFSMIEDQRYILKQVYEISRREKADALVLAGDIYDRAIPPADAVVLFNDFLTDMVRAGIPVLMISGNHDSPERLGFADAILEEEGIYIAGVYKEELKKVEIADTYGNVSFVLMPFVKPASVGAKTSGEAVGNMLSMEKGRKEDNIDKDDMDKDNKNKEGEDGIRRVLVTHYFVTDQGREPELSDGETTIHVGGLDNVEASLFDGFDYVALGHIHKPQKIGEREVYYAGAPLAYSFSEAGQEKGINLVEMGKKGEVTMRRIPLKPLHEMRRIRGKLQELMQPEVVEAAQAEDYIRAELTDEEELIDPIGTLRSVYPNVMQILLTKNEKKENMDYISRPEEKKKSIPQLFLGFYEMIRGEKPDEGRMKVVEEAAKEAEAKEVEGMDV